LASTRAPAAALREGLVVASHGRHVWVETPQGERWMCHARGKKSQTVVGDQVLWMPSQDEGTIEQVLERRNLAMADKIPQTRARHILLRPDAVLSPVQAQARLAELRGRILGGKVTFEAAARDVSQDGSAADGGELGWASPGMFVPEFEDAMNRLAPGEISAPLASRFGVHLIQVLERRSTDMTPAQLRERERDALRARRYDENFVIWERDVRDKAFVEMREAR
jgi:peptidyl-prolyl cis-trans isomerase SurA